MTPDPRKSRLLNLLSGISDMSAEDEARLIEVFESQIGDDDVLENDQRDNLVLQIRNAIGHGEFDHEPEFLRLLNQAAIKAAQNTCGTYDDQTPGITSGVSEHQIVESGTRIGDFEIVEFIASGGMGAVYRAHQSGLDRIVALKLIRSSPQHRKASVRFQQEMKAVGRLNHPNIVRALHAGDSDSGPYLALEFINGENLSATIAKSGLLPITSACQIILQAAEGLRHAHAAGLIHRDIKPSNLIMTSDGVVKILDLGLARVDAEVDDRLTQEGQFMGTVDYMAPEQAGDAMQADQRSDIYSLGCTFYELLTGSPPFSSQRYKSAAAKIVAHSKDKPPDVSLFRTDVPERLRNIVLKMMAKEPDARFADCGQLIEALHEFLEEFRQHAASPQPMKTVVGANRRQSVGNGESSTTGQVVRPEKTPIRGKREQLLQDEKKLVYRRSDKRVTLVAASLLIFCLLAWQIVVRTSHGILIIEIPDGVKGVPVEITESDGGSRHLTVSTEENAVRVALGKTQVRITDATLSDLNLEEGTLAVKRGENRIRISRKSHVKNQKTQAHASSEPPQNENSDSANDRIQAAVIKPIALSQLDPSLIPPAETLPGLPLDVVAVLDSRSLYPTAVQKSKLILHPSAELCFAGGQIWSLKTGFPIDSNLTMELAGTAFGHGGQVVFNGNKLYSLARSSADPDGWTIKAESVLSQSKMYNAAAFSVNDEWLAASVTSSRQLDVFHLTDDTYAFVTSIPLELSDGVAVNSLQLLNNGRLHVYASSAGGYDEQEETLSAVLELSNPEAPVLNNVQRTSGHWVFSADGTVSVCREAAPGHALKIYEVENGELPVFEADGQYTDVTISGDGHTILGTNLSGVQMFTKHDGMWQQKIVPPGGFRLCLTVSSDGKTLVAASNHGALDVWSLTGDIATLINPSQPTRVSHLSISPDGRFVGLSGTGPGRVLRLDGDKPIELPMSSPPNVDGEWKFSSDSKFAADPYQDHLWDLSGETSVSVPGHTTCVGHDILIDWPAGESSGEFLIARHSQSKLQRLPWKVDAAGFHTGSASAEWTLEHGIQLSNWSAHSRRYISRDPTDGTVFVWKLDSNSPKAINTCRLQGNPGTGDAEALSSSGNTAVSFGRSMDLVSWQFDPSNLDDVPREYRIPGKFVEGAVITPNDKYIVCAEGVTLTAYSVDLTMQPVSIRLPINIRSLKMHPDGIHVLTVNSNGTCFVVRIPALAD